MDHKQTPSALRLQQRLAAGCDSRRMLQTEALYSAQVAYTCQILEIVDEVADTETAERITDAIGEQLAGTGATEAMRRDRERLEEYERLLSTPRSPR